MINNWKLKKISQLLILFALINFNLNAKVSDAPPEKGIFDLWNYEQVVDIDLTFDLETVFTDRRGEVDHPARISFEDETGQEQAWQIKVSTRGNFRRQKCNEVPPLKIDFKKGDLREAGLAEFDDFKLVTHCIDDYQAAKELLLKEYLIYKMFNQLTDLSYRVQLVDITYRDTNSGKKKRQMGFLIEDTAQLRARIGAEKVEVKRVVEAQEHAADYRKMVALFQYMIGNSDYGITHSKNIKYILKDDKVLSVPYDFDFAAAVDAPYLMYTKRYGQTSRYDRVYLGFERSYEVLEPTIELFEQKKTELYQTVYDMRLLKRSSREEMIAYLDTFFENTKEIKFPENWY